MADLVGFRIDRGPDYRELVPKGSLVAETGLTAFLEHVNTYMNIAPLNDLASFRDWAGQALPQIIVTLQQYLQGDRSRLPIAQDMVYRAMWHLAHGAHRMEYDAIENNIYSFPFDLTLEIERHTTAISGQS